MGAIKRHIKDLFYGPLKNKRLANDLAGDLSDLERKIRMLEFAYDCLHRNCEHMFINGDPAIWKDPYRVAQANKFSEKDGRSGVANETLG